MPRKLNCKVLIKPTHVSLVEIVKSENEIAYSEFLKKLWVYWKANKLCRVVKL